MTVLEVSVSLFQSHSLLRKQDNEPFGYNFCGVIGNKGLQTQAYK